MWYSEDDFYEVRAAQVEADKKLASDKLEAELFSSVREVSTMDRAKYIMKKLESDDSLMSDFNLLMRQKKLNQLKSK